MVVSIVGKYIFAMQKNNHNSVLSKLQRINIAFVVGKVPSSQDKRDIFRAPLIHRIGKVEE